MTFHDLHNFGRTHIGPISIFGSKCGCIGWRNLTSNKCRMVEALPAEAVVNQTAVGGAFEFDSAISQLTQSIPGYPGEGATQIVDGMREFMPDNTNLGIKWLIL